MSKTWQLQEAKNRLSTVIDEAIHHGPQVITRRSIETAVLISVADYKRMLVSQDRLSHFFRESPLVGKGLALTRDTTPTRAAMDL